MSFQNLSSRLTRICAFLLVIAMAACGGSGTTTGMGAATDCTHPSISDQDGCAYVSLTDSPGDFLTYTVDVTELTLTRSDGTVVNLLPGNTRVDFTKYSNLSEFLTLAAVPPGIYTGGSITLDYTDADIEVTDSNGNAQQVAPVDAGGDPVTTMTLAINLDSQGALALAPGVPQVYQVDFDLDASNLVDLNNSTVVVQPFLVASVNPNLDNQVQVRGPLATIDAATDDFTLGLMPFYATSGDYGNLRVFTTNATIYNINQTAYTGNPGLTALASAGATTAVVARGSFDFTSNHFVATEVDAGSSVPGGTLDAAEGVVLSRSGNNLVLRGATLYRTGQSAVFSDSVAVMLGTNTKVHQVGSALNGQDISTISVGQRLLVFGSLTNTNPASLALDASSGFALLEFTSFDGLVTSAPASSGSGASMAVGLQFIEGRPVSMFDFAGTGTSGATDADPTNYVVSLPSLLSSIAVNDPVRVFGFVTPFGSAPPDFTGATVADYANTDARIAMAWVTPGSKNIFTSMSSTSGVVINLTSTPTPLLAQLRQGGITTQLTSLATAPTVQANLGIFAIAQNGTVQVHVAFGGFLADLDARLTAGGRVRGYFANGGFTSSTDTLNANVIAVIIQ